MTKLNLTATGRGQELILAYLQENASETLAEKINGGVIIEKDGKHVRNKKTLDGFMQYAAGEAQKLAEKGARSACIEDATVYGWAMHYFEEDSIEGTFYNLDGTEYKPAPAPVKKSPIPTYTPPAPKPKPQMSIFDDFFKTGQTESPPTVSETDTDDENNGDKTEEAADDPEIELPDEEEQELPEAETKIEIPQTEQQRKQGIPLYQSYMHFQEQYPDSIIAYRLGDFYEIFGENARRVSDALDLTLTSRDCGLDERVPMVGFPYHASDIYFQKISGFYDIVVVDNEKTYMIKNGKIIDIETGEVLDSEPETENEKPFSPSTFHKDTMILLYEMLDGKMNLQ